MAAKTVTDFSVYFDEWLARCHMLASPLELERRSDLDVELRGRQRDAHPDIISEIRQRWCSRCDPPRRHTIKVIRQPRREPAAATACAGAAAGVIRDKAARAAVPGSRTARLRGARQFRRRGRI